MFTLNMVEKVVRGGKMKGYNQVSVPEELYRVIKEYCRENEFRSVGEFIRTASREYMNSHREVVK